MALNPFFLQGSPGEQRLVQDLINEQLKIYGVEVIYIPRKFVRKETIIEEVSSSVFDDNFLLEAYVNNYEGYSGSGDILTKFGVSLKDDLSLIISKERFDDFISPFLDSMNDDEIELSTRPREGDIVYFPLGQRLFEVKFIEHEQPFYQLGKTYIYELRCELFEYEDEVLNTSISEVDELIQDEGYITTLKLISTQIGQQATAQASIGFGYIKKIYLNNDGYEYIFPPTVKITESPLGILNPSANAAAIAITKKSSVKEILLINSGFGYTSVPKITISGGGGIGAAATCSIETQYLGVTKISVDNGGVGYTTSAIVSIDSPELSSDGCLAKAVIDNGEVANIYITNSGVGYTSPPLVNIDPPLSFVTSGTFKYNEIVVGSRSGASARVKYWDQNSNILKVSINSGKFFEGEQITGTESSATYLIENYDNNALYDKYAQNKEIQDESNSIVDFSQSNPFGNY